MNTLDYPGCLDREKKWRAIEGLNVYLANLSVLYIKLHNLHWNVVGVGFFDLHAKTQVLYEAIAGKFDELAERIKALGFLPLASMREYLQVATIGELPSQPIATTDVPQIIIADFCSMVSLLRNIAEVAKDTIEDCGLLSEGICFFEKNIWMMNAYLGRG